MPNGKKSDMYLHKTFKSLMFMLSTYDFFLPPGRFKYFFHNSLSKLEMENCFFREKNWLREIFYDHRKIIIFRKLP